MRNSTAPGARLPHPVPVAVALDQPLGALLAPGRAGQAAHLQLHQPLGGKADHLAQEIGVRGLLDQAAQGHHLVGHRGSPIRLACRKPDHHRRPRDDHRVAACLPARQSAQAAADATVELHHQRGHDLEVILPAAIRRVRSRHQIGGAGSDARRLNIRSRRPATASARLERAVPLHRRRNAPWRNSTPIMPSLWSTVERSANRVAWRIDSAQVEASLAAPSCRRR